MIICIYYNLLEAKDFACSHVLPLLLLWVTGAGHCKLAQSPVVLSTTPCRSSQLLWVSGHLRCSVCTWPRGICFPHARCTWESSDVCKHSLGSQRGREAVLPGFSLGEHVWCTTAAKQASLCHQSPAVMVLDMSTGADVDLECGERHKELIPSGARSHVCEPSDSHMCL